ncbi:hypothetical protein LCGC14_0359400 [marine sediment metagenome]|uniref:HNH nuclease domain-containing protein n=1 Tax=marine sediment metagenome TaxID=412755 RepID=A0A0F9T8G7_9ZZZZ|nr:hypothetical protein [Candidatus Aminicenantes bacterium]
MTRLPINLTDEQHTLIKAESIRTGISISEIMRILIDRMKVRKNKTITKLFFRPVNRTEWRNIIKRRDNNKCQNCGIQGTKKTVDAHHIIPMKQGGKDEITNGKTLCKPCHKIEHLY